MECCSAWYRYSESYTTCGVDPQKDVPALTAGGDVIRDGVALIAWIPPTNTVGRSISATESNRTPLHPTSAYYG